MKTSNPTMTMKAADDLPIEDDLPSLSGAVQWLNSPPLTDAALKGKVVLIDFWTYSCINCLRELPYVRAWAEKYKDHGLVVIGVHAPEFAFERNVDNVKKAVAKLKLEFPIAIDNDYAIWRAFDNEDWPAEYFVDARGRIRHHQFGEGDYATSERVIQELLVAAGQTDVPIGLVTVNASGAEAASDAKDDQLATVQRRARQHDDQWHDRQHGLRQWPHPHGDLQGRRKEGLRPERRALGQLRSRRPQRADPERQRARQRRP